MATAVERMLANNLADFEGLRIEGTIVINEALLNAFIQDYINNLSTEPEVSATQPANPALNVPQLLQALRIDQANVHLQEGKMYIDLKIRR